MKKFFKTSLSVICIITMLASLIIPSIVMPASAYSFDVGQDVIRYTFDGDFSVGAVGGTATAGGAFAISNGALEVKADHERCVAFNNGTEEWLTLEDGAYMVEIKYTYTESQFEKTIATGTSTRGTIRSVSKDTFKPTDYTVGDDYTDPILTFEEGKIGQELTACAYLEFKGTTGNNVAFCAGGKTYCYIKEIAISKKSFIDVIASDGYNTAPITTLSGGFGDDAELPGKESFEKENSCEGFNGFFADPEFKKPINKEKFTFPTDVLKTTVYAKMDFVNPVAVNIDFETQIADETNKTTFATIDTISKDGNENNKAFKSKIADNFANGQWGRGKMIYNSDHSSIVINAGWYTVSWDYIITGEKTPLQDHATKNKAYFINSYDKNDGNYSAAHTPISGADFDLLPDKKTLNTWQTETRKVFLPEDVEDFGIFFAPLEAVVYIDNIQFTPIVAEPDLSIDFSEQSECDEGSSIYKVAKHTNDGHENSLGIIFSGAYDGGEKAAQIKQGGSSCGGGVTCTHKTDDSKSLSLKAGTYLIKYSYYVTTAKEGYNATKLKPELFTFKFAYNTSNAQPNTLLDEDIIKELTQDQWHTASMLISLEKDISTFGFYLKHCPYHIYIDDISVYSVNFSSSSMVIDFEGLLKNTNTTDTTGIANIGTHIGVDSNPNNTVFAFLNNNGGYARGNTIKGLEKNFYSIKAGTYKISWNYKIVTTSSYTAGKAITGNLFLIDGYDKNVADDKTNKTNAKRIDCASFDLLPDRTKIGEWQEANVVVTLKTDIEKLGLFVDSLTAGVNAYVDNITFTPTSDVAVKTAFYLLFRTPIDTELKDAQGNKMEANSAVYTDPNGDLRSAFRFLSSFNYHKSGKDLYLDYDRQIKIVKRGMKVGIATKDAETGIYTYDQKTKSEKAASATAWSNKDANLEYTFMMFNISEKNKDTVYFATPYLVLEIKGKQFVILGETKKTSVEDVFATSQAKADGATWYY